MKIKFVSSGEKKKIMKELKEKFGIENLPYILLETGKEKIRGFSGTMTREEINELSEIVNIEIIGAYLLRKDFELRLSLDATQILSEQIKKGIIEINEEEFNSWIRGKNLDLQKERNPYVLKYKNDFVGCGISDTKKIMNFIPKERRIRN